MRIAILTTDNREHRREYSLPEPYFGTAVEALLQGFVQMPQLEAHVISCTQRPMKSPEKLAHNIWFHSLSVPKIGWLRTGYQGCIRAVRRKLRELKPEIVHGQGTERDCAISAVFSGFPNVITIHGNMRSIADAMKARIGSYLWCAALLETFILPRTTGIFCNSAYTESVVQSLSRRTWRVPNAIRREFFETPLSQKPATSKPILLNVGFVTPYKRQLEVLETARDLQRDGNVFELQFVGPADRKNHYGAAFLHQIADAERNGFARHVEPKSLQELITTFDMASALIHVPSEEAFGLVVAEALARNLKVFGTDVGGVSDIARQIEGAELFALADSKGLRSGISRWLRAGCPGPQSASKAMLRYHPKAIAARHMEIYRELLRREESV